jgi:hypothetical protein
MSAIDDLLKELENRKGDSSPLLALNESDYEKVSYIENSGSWIVKSKTSNRYRMIPGNESDPFWKDKSISISKSKVDDLMGVDNSKGKKIDISSNEIDSVTMQVLLGKTSIADYEYNVLTTPTSNRKYKGSGNKFTDDKGNISFYYNSNSESWKIGLRDGTTKPIPSGDVPVSIWNKAGLVKPQDLIVGGVSSSEELNSFLSGFNTFTDARNAGLNLSTDPTKAGWYKPNESAMVSPTGNTYLKSSYGWVVTGKNLNNIFGKSTIEITNKYSPLEFESDMSARKGWNSPFTSGVENMWVNKFGQPSSLDPARMKAEEKLSNKEKKKRT